MKEDKVVDAIIEEEKPFFFPRLVAFIIDSILVFLLSLGVAFVLPANEKHDKYVKELEQLQVDHLEIKVLDDEYAEKLKDLVYDVDYTGALVTFTQVIVFIGYFVVFQHKNNGQTIGKKIMKLKVVSTNSKELSLGQVAIRAGICDSIIINFLLVACVLLVGRNNYYYASFGLQLLNYGIIIIALFMILFRKDGKGLHDVLAKTKVVSTK